MRYKPIDIDEAFELFKLRKEVAWTLTGTRSRIPFWKFCDMLKQGGWTII